mmetsp:Transcript_8468/g.28071  ORF Transcript_8468/g.28071 Transcript_8468/m.28071 type:complete len:233 (+) Transcript_8468:860-1558(+)
MIAATVTACGAFQLPYTSEVVPVKSKCAPPVSRSRLSSSLMVDPSSILSSDRSTSLLPTAPSGSCSAMRSAVALSISRTATSALSWTYSMYAPTTAREYSSMSSLMSEMPRWLAATCAWRSERLSSILRVPMQPLSGCSSSFRIPFSWNSPALTSLNALMAAPSSDISREKGGMEPGVMPPTSAWCPRDATRNTILPSRKTGVTTVMSGRCEPPACGWLLTRTSPSWRSSPQ